MQESSEMELSTASERRKGVLQLKPRAVLGYQSVTCALHCALPCSKSTTLGASQQANSTSHPEETALQCSPITAKRVPPSHEACTGESTPPGGDLQGCEKEIKEKGGTETSPPY